MLTRLDIRGLAIIESLSIEFSSSLNVITGETGAGKSILIKALSLISGAKASSEVVREGFDAANVAASFLVPVILSFTDCLEVGLPVEKVSGAIEILIRRQIQVKGRSQAWVNDLPVGLGTLRKIAASLIDIFAQHETHRFLDSSLHVDYLDKFVKDKRHFEVYRSEFQQVQDELSKLRRRGVFRRSLKS